MVKIRNFASFTVILILTLLFVNCTEDSPTTPSIDFVAPYVEWMNLSNSAELSGTVEFSFSVYDENGIDSVKLYLNGAQLLGSADIPPIVVEGKPVGENTDTTITTAWNTLDYEDGVYILEARAWDTSGNLGTSPSLMVNVNNEADPPPEDRLAPYVHWIAPEGGSTLKSVANLRVMFYDENGVDTVNLLKNGAVILAYKTSIDSLVYYWDTRADSDDVYIWEVRAWDEAGNMGVSPALLLRVQNNEEPPPEDRNPPVINWVSPDPGDTLEGTVTLCFQMMDNVSVDSVWVWINGVERFSFEGKDNEIYYEADWTIDIEDGICYIVVGGVDRGGNTIYSPPFGFYIWNNHPRVIWVPDDYETIQGAINASEDGDTVRVKPGIYHGAIDFWDKNIWLESEEGPELTIIEANNCSWGIRIEGSQDTTSGIRGFIIRNSEYNGIELKYRASPKILNNIISSSAYNNIYALINRAIIMNNVMTDAPWDNMALWISTGQITNNIIIHSEQHAIWNSDLFPNPIIPDYNLIWDYQWRSNEPPINFGPHNIFDQDPLFEEGSYILRNDSPCKNSGHPDLFNLDGSRSDIGVYGGPYSYPIPQ